MRPANHAGAPSGEEALEAAANTADDDEVAPSQETVAGGSAGSTGKDSKDSKEVPPELLEKLNRFKPGMSVLTSAVRNTDKLDGMRGTVVKLLKRTVKVELAEGPLSGKKVGYSPDNLLIMDGDEKKDGKASSSAGGAASAPSVAPSTAEGAPEATTEETPEMVGQRLFESDCEL